MIVPPLSLMGPDPTSVDIGEPVVLMCVAFGIPLPSYTWFHDGVQVEGGTRVHVNNGTLRIDSLRREDGGEYECRAENEAGVMTSSALLQVYGEWGVQGGILPGNDTHTHTLLACVCSSKYL